VLRGVLKDKTNLTPGVGGASLSDTLLERRHGDYMTWTQMSISTAEMSSFMNTYSPSKRKRISIPSRMEAPATGNKIEFWIYRILSY